LGLNRDSRRQQSQRKHELFHTVCFLNKTTESGRLKIVRFRTKPDRPEQGGVAGMGAVNKKNLHENGGTTYYNY